MLPKQRELEEPILQVLADNGGKARPEVVYESVKKFFPTLTDADLLLSQPSGDNKFKNTIRFARQTLIDRGEMYSPAYGLWGITARGEQRLRDGDMVLQTAVRPKPVPTTQIQVPALTTNLEELFDDYVDAFRRKLVQGLLDLSPAQFEKFAGELLTAYGFRNTKVTNTNTAPDGGIDGSGELKVGLASVRAAFQCKRWKGQIGRPEIDKFRGAIQGRFEHGYFFTTSSFSVEARQASVRDGTVPIFLFDGHEISQIMIDKGLGVTRRPIEVYEDRVESLFETTDPTKN
jgi:restriction system protein